MNRPAAKELGEILARHQLWLEDKEGGEYANLRDADLRGADLWDANLWGANLRGATGNMREIKSIFVEEYPIAYTSHYLQIGCERHPITDWWEFDDTRIGGMDEGALVFWQKWKAYIQQTISMSPAIPTKNSGASE